MKCLPLLRVWLNIKAVHVPGKSLVVADTLSYNPLAGLRVSDTEEIVQVYAEAVIHAMQC